MTKIQSALVVVAVCLTLPILGACGYFAASAVAHLHADHQLIDAARAADAQRVQQAAEQIKQYQQSQQSPQAVQPQQQAVQPAPVAPPAK